MKIYVGNLPRNASEEDLSKLFESYGNVVSAIIIKDRASGQSKGFGFVEMQDEEAKAAIKALHGSVFQGRPLTVNEARPREERPMGGGGGFRPRGNDYQGRPDKTSAR